MEVKKKVIWLVNKHAAPMQYNATNLRTFKLAHYFGEMGHDVRIICSGYVHNRNINIMKSSSLYEEQVFDGVKYIFIKTTPYTKNGLKRIYSLYEFSKIVPKLQQLSKPDVIIHTTNIPFDYNVFSYAKKIKAKYIVEVVDLWPESFVAFGIIKKNNPLLKLMYKVERYLYTKADKIVFSMEGGRDYIKDKKWDIENGGSVDLSKVEYLNNGTDIDDFDYNKVNWIIHDKDLEDDSIRKIIYLGSIRLANNLKQLIDAAVEFKDKRDLKFLIYGDGEDRPALELYCKNNNLDNVIFKEKWVELKYVPYILSKSYMNIINYKPNSIERYGGSQNKLFQALSSSKPVCSNAGMGYSLIRKYNLGIDEEFKNTKEYASAIQSLLDLSPSDYMAMCLRSRETAEMFDLKKTAKKYMELI